MDAAKRLSIVVPYRDRESHLRAFVPHMQAYFGWGNIPCHVTIAEQEEGLPFNRGAMKNIGFLLAGPSDYTCFHDIDYLPLTADYRWADRPTSILWYGAETRPVAPGRSMAFTTHDLGRLFGGAVLIPNELFRQVNGYSNQYWGRGPEDIDLVNRFVAASIPLARRKGTFSALDHDSEAFDLAGSLKPAARANNALMARKWAPGARIVEDGLSTVSYEVLSRENISGGSDASYEKILVRLKMDPGDLPC